MSISRSSLEQGTTVEETANAFVAIRPPGHHCGEDTPSGFCFVNNVVVAAAHGKYQVIFFRSVFLMSCQPTLSIKSRKWLFLISIFTMVSKSHFMAQSTPNCSLGNGTQSLVWQVNEEWYRRKLEIDHGAPNTELGVQIFYGSLHDILSYPCEVRHKKHLQI